MREKQESGSVPVPAEFMSAQSAIVGLRGKDLLTTVRSLAVHGLRQPLHSARHLVAFGGQLGKVLLGDTLHQPNPQDARFQDPSWRLNPFYRRTLQAYLAWQKQLLAWIDESNLDCDDRARARFLVALLSDAVAPSNSLINPLAVKELFNTGGISLLNGVRHLLEDLVHNGGMPSQVNKTAFEIGRNLATTQGAVVFRNEVLELIQYKPLGERQYAKPLLIVPPQINKYYIFDLSPEKSFVQYALKNNLQVFVISWRNPDAQHREWGLSTYVEALDQAIEVSREITGSRSVNLAGACAGGLTVAALLGHLQVRRQLRKVSSVTYLVSLLDSQMESPAMLFADEQTLESSKRRSYQHGVLDGRDMAKVFAWMRPNDLIWNYWVNNYLLGTAAGVRHPLLEQRQHAAARGVPRRTARPVQAQPADPPGRAGGQRDRGGPGQGGDRQLPRRRHHRPHHALGRGLSLGPPAGRPAPLHPVQQRAHPEHPQPSRKPQGLLLRERQAEQRSTRLVLRRQARRGQLVAGLAGLAAGALGRAGQP